MQESQLLCSGTESIAPSIAFLSFSSFSTNKLNVAYRPLLFSSNYFQINTKVANIPKSCPAVSNFYYTEGSSVTYQYTNPVSGKPCPLFQANGAVLNQITNVRNSILLVKLKAALISPTESRSILQILRHLSIFRSIERSIHSGSNVGMAKRWDIHRELTGCILFCLVRNNR
jgi:hypothetical protein